MKFIFPAEELAYVNNLLTALAQTANDRSNRRNLKRLADKFLIYSVNGPREVWLKPSDQEAMKSILLNGAKAIESTRNQIKQKSIFERIGSSFKKEPAHIEKVEGLMKKVLGRLGVTID